MSKKTLGLILFLVMVFTVALAACGSDDKSDEVETTETPLIPIAMQIAWTYDYSSSHLYLAKVNGHFAAGGLDVTILEGGYQDGANVKVIDTVLSGNAQFGATTGSGLLKARAEGDPIVAIAVLTQISPFSLLALPDSGIATPDDLIGKTVAIARADSRSTSLLLVEAMLHTQNIDPADINFVTREGYNIDPLLDGEYDVLGGWIINEGLQVSQATGHEPSIIVLSDYGVDDYQSLLFTTEDMLNTQPEVVEAFVRGFILGLNDVVADPAKAAEATLTYNEELDLDDQKAHINLFLPLIDRAGVEMGSLDPDTLAFTHQILVDEGVIEPLDLESTYSLVALNAIYGD
ncbi:MAG: ABC transporter substrate-binding protein [Anaerolineae bacterium]|nr:ABC transporter substrate-binding protein [Anaerolineae bacterium]